MDKLISYSALRKALGAALRPMRGSIYIGRAPEPVEFMGYRFEGSRLYKAPGQIGHVWTYYYTGYPCPEETKRRWPYHIGGGIEDCAEQLHARLYQEFKETQAAKAEGAGDWTPWKGGDCPVPLATVVDVQFGNGTILSAITADSIDWAWDREDGDIVGYRQTTE